MADALKPAAFSELPGWSDEAAAAGLAAFQRSAVELIEEGSGFRRTSAFGGMRADWLAAAKKALDQKPATARDFFESEFVPCRVFDSERPHGLFTGYYEPVVHGSRTRHDAYNVPLMRKPADLVAFSPAEERATGLRYGRHLKSGAAPYLTRQEIEMGALEGQGLEICWIDSWVDAFFLQVQGQGRVRLEEGGEIRLSYAAKSGHPYTGLGAELIRRGCFTPESISMQALRCWMAENPHEARGLMWQNKSYVFFRETAVDDQALGAIGAARVNLTPYVSMAVDRAHWAFGTPFWLETSTPPEALGGAEPIRRLVVAQDTGSAIRGIIRGDLYWGWGEEAAHMAGHMKSRGTLTALLPAAVVQRLGLVP